MRRAGNGFNADERIGALRASRQVSPSLQVAPQVGESRLVDVARHHSRATRARGPAAWQGRLPMPERAVSQSVTGFNVTVAT